MYNKLIKNFLVKIKFNLMPILDQDLIVEMFWT